MSVITKLEVENIKRLRAICIELDPDEPGAVLIGGENGAGKSSTLDSVQYGIAGVRAIPDVPIREGEDSAFTKITLSTGMTIERKFKPGGKTSLTVKDADGNKVTSPQAVLDALWSAIACDPLKFSTQEASKRVDALREVSGLDFTKMDREYQIAYDERTIVNRKVRDLEGQVREMPHHKDAPKEMQKVSELQAELKSAMDALRSLADLEREAAQKAERITETETEIENTMNRIVELRQRMKQLQSNLEDEKKHADLSKAAVEKAKSETPDVDAITERMENVTGINDKVRDNLERIKAKNQVKDARSSSEQLSQEMKDIEKEKSEQLAAAKLPVPGLGFGDKDITLNDLPWEQASQAEKLRVSTAMALALNPGIRVLLIRDASILDDKNLSMISDMAEGAKAQVWMEVVRGDVSIVIEDGERVA